MQDQTKLLNNGQELALADLNDISAVASHADDIVFAELLKFPPFDGSNVSRGVVTNGSVVGNGGATVLGGVCVLPFRAAIGSRSTTPSSLEYGDARTALYVNSSGTTNERTIALSAQTAGAGTARVDLIYATIYVDQPASSASVYIKDPLTLAVASTPGVYKKLSTYVTVAVVAGTASTTPTLPTIPSDPAGGYNIPLAYVRLDNGFTSSSVVPSSAIMEAATVVTLRGTTGPANKMGTAGTKFFNGIAKGGSYLPSTMVGKIERFFAIDNPGTTVLNTDTIDDSVDWRNRIFKLDVQVAAGGTAYAWNTAGSSSLPSGVSTRLLGNSFYTGTTDVAVASLTGGLLGSNTVKLMVSATTGRLYVDYSGTPPTISLFFWLDASAPLPNAG